MALRSYLGSVLAEPNNAMAPTVRRSLPVLYHRMSDSEVAFAASVVATRPWSPGGDTRTRTERAWVEMLALGGAVTASCLPWQCATELVAGYQAVPQERGQLFQGEREVIRFLFDETLRAFGKATVMKWGTPPRSVAETLAVVETITSIDAAIRNARAAGETTTRPPWVPILRNYEQALSAGNAITSTTAQAALDHVERVEQQGGAVPRAVKDFLVTKTDPI